MTIGKEHEKQYINVDDYIDIYITNLHSKEMSPGNQPTAKVINSGFIHSL